MKIKYKKAFEGILAILESNQNKKVSEIIEDIRDTCKKNKAGARPKAHLQKGILFLHCAYFNMWFNSEKQEFGKKGNSPTGKNNICKEGARLYQSAAAKFKRKSHELLRDIYAGTIKAELMGNYLIEYEKERDLVPEPSVTGYRTLAEAIEKELGE